MQHSETGVTALMAAAARGSLDTAELLLALGARVTIRAFSCDSSALDLALSNNHQDIVDLLTSYMLVFCVEDIQNSYLVCIVEQL